MRPYAPALSILIGVLIGLQCGIARADGLIVIDRAPARPGHFAFAPLQVSFHHVDVEINDLVATTKVDQEFVNPNGQALEGTYLFPLPEGATIDKFAMDIDGKTVDAELLDAAKARSIYEEIVRKYRDPALLEYVGRGAMKVRIFPIEANGKKHIQLRYTQVIKPDSGVMEYSYPLNTEKFSSELLQEVAVRVKLTSGTAIKSIYCPTHSIDIQRDGDRKATVGFEAKNVRPDTDFKLIITRQADPIGINLLTYRTGGGNGYFMLMASPGVELAANQIQPKDICFVLDTSGSMAQGKLEQAKKALNFCLANLNDADRFEVIRFSTESESLFGSLSSASRQNIERAMKFVADMKPTGGTAIDAALAKAVDMPRTEGRPYHVIFLTDGQPTVGETSEDRIMQRLGGPMSKLPVRIFPFGIGTDVNTTLLDRIANDTHATSQYVLANEDIEVKVSSFYSKIQSPVLGDVRFACDDPDVKLTQVYPGALPDLFKGETLVAFGKYSFTDSAEHRDRKAHITLSGTLNGARRETVAEVNFTADDTHHAFIPRLWATRRVGWLLDEIRLHGESKELKDEITQLARENGIVTPYTAYLIMEDERARQVPVSARTMRELDGDTRARVDVARQYSSANGSSQRLERAGQQAVDNAVALNSLKAGDNLQQAQQQQGLAKAMPAAAPYAQTQPVSGYKIAVNYAQQVKLVNGRAFYQNGSTWTDNSVQSNSNLKRQEIKFNSDEYFSLLAKYPAAIPWFSLGEEVDVVIDDTLYVVR